MRNRNTNHTFYHNEVVIKCAIVCTILLHKMMMLASQEILVTLTHHLFNLKLQQTNYFLIPKMLQILIFNIIVVILNILIIEDFSLQLLFISLIHNFEYSFVSEIADITNIVSKSFVSKNVRDNDFSFHNSISANIKAHIAANSNKIFVPIIAVIV